MVFDKLRTKIDSHFHSSPLASQRKDFMAVDSTTPIERKAHFTADVVGAAAAYEAFKAFERHEVHNGHKPTHARSKEIIVGLAVGFAAKMIDEKGLPFTSDSNKVKFKKEAQMYAARDAKRSIRDSGLYEANEMEPIDEDEKLGRQL